MKEKKRKLKMAFSKKPEISKKDKSKSSAEWPETFRWLATGALVVYTAMGVQIVKPAYAQGSQVPAGQSQSAGSRVYQFNIPAGSLDDVIDAFETLTGLEIELARTGLSRIPSPGVQGSLSVDQAIERLLQGTGVVSRYRNSTTLVFDLQSAASSVEVAGQISKLSSPKYTQPLLDLPQTVSVIPEQIFAEQGARNLTEVLRNTPGITFEAGENGFASGTSNFSLRGIDTTGNIFIDGARDSGNYFRDVFNIEQVEVVKGPSADNGRGGAGGYVNMATKTPKAETFHRLSLAYGFDEYGSKNRPRAAFDVNRRIGEGTGLRLNAFWDEGGVIGREVAERKSWGLAPSLAFGLLGPTRFSVGYQVVKQGDRPDWGVPGAMVPGMRTYNPATGGGAYRNRFYGHVNDYDDVMSHAFLGRFDHDFSDRVRLRNTTRWSGTDRYSLYAVPTAFTEETMSVTAQRQAYARDNQSFSNLTNLETSFNTGWLTHVISSGIDVSSEKSDANRYPTNGILGNPGNTSLVTPDPWRPLTGFAGLNPTQVANININTVAGYVYDTVQLHRKLLLNAGLRLERYGVSLKSRTLAGASQGPDGFDRHDTTLNGKAGLVYKPVERGSIYGSFGVSTMSPASFLSNPDISREGDNAFPGWDNGPNSSSSKVQRAKNYELGTKWGFNRDRLITTAALFRTERTNIAMEGTLNGVANSFAGYGKQVIQGIELGATGTITKDWSVFGGVLFMNSERIHSPQVDAARIAANPGDYGSATTTNGDQLAFTPRVSANLWTTYRLPFNLTLGGGVRHLTDSYLGRPDNAVRIIPNGNAGKLPGYTVVDLMAAYRVNRHFTLRFNMDNAGDTYYPVSANWNGSRALLGPTRSFRIGTDIYF